MCFGRQQRQEPPFQGNSQEHIMPTAAAKNNCRGGAADVIHSRHRQQPSWPGPREVISLDTKASTVSGLDEVKGLDTETADTPTSTPAATRSLPSWRQDTTAEEEKSTYFDRLQRREPPFQGNSQEHIMPTAAAENNCRGGDADVVHSGHRRQPSWPGHRKVTSLDTKASTVSGLDKVKGLDTETADTPASTPAATGSLPSWRRDTAAEEERSMCFGRQQRQEPPFQGSSQERIIPTAAAKNDCRGGAADVIHSRHRQQPSWPGPRKVISLDKKASTVSGLDEVKGLDTETADTPTSTPVAAGSLPSTSTPTRILLHQGHSADVRDGAQSFDIVYTSTLGTQQKYYVTHLENKVLLCHKAAPTAHPLLPPGPDTPAGFNKVSCLWFANLAHCVGWYVGEHNIQHVSLEPQTVNVRSTTHLQAKPFCRDKRNVKLWPQNSKPTTTKTHTLVVVMEPTTSTKFIQTDHQAQSPLHLHHRHQGPAKDPGTTLQAQVSLHQYSAKASKVTMSEIESTSTNCFQNGGAASAVHPLPDQRRKERRIVIKVVPLLELQGQARFILSISYCSHLTCGGLGKYQQQHTQRNSASEESSLKINHRRQTLMSKSMGNFSNLSSTNDDKQQTQSTIQYSAIGTRHARCQLGWQQRSQRSWRRRRIKPPPGKLPTPTRAATETAGPGQGGREQWS